MDWSYVAKRQCQHHKESTGVEPSGSQKKGQAAGNVEERQRPGHRKKWKVLEWYQKVGPR